MCIWPLLCRVNFLFFLFSYFCELLRGFFVEVGIFCFCFLFFLSSLPFKCSSSSLSSLSELSMSLASSSSCLLFSSFSSFKIFEIILIFFEVASRAEIIFSEILERSSSSKSSVLSYHSS